MAKNDQAMEVQKQEEIPGEEMERTRSRRSFVPRADIYETENEIIVLTDIPGANKDTVDIMLEKNLLTIRGMVEEPTAESYELAYAEYPIGDYERTFALSDEVDKSKIEATMKNGVLRLLLPKAEEAKVRKIAVRLEE